MNQRERFEAWAQVEYRNADDYTHAEYDAGFAAWQEAERQMIERCAAVCDEKAGRWRTGNPRAVGNNWSAIGAEYCAELIRALNEPTKE